MNRNLISALIFITSLLISSKDNEKLKDSNLPNFRNILEVKHSIPGRIRLYCRKLKDYSEYNEILISTFSKIPGIKNVSTNLKIGTILIEYDQDKIEPMLIIGIILKVMELEEDVKTEAKALVTRESKDILESLNHTIYEKTSGILDLKSSVMIFIGSYAIYDIKTRPGIRPGGFTCLWWLYSLMNRGF